MDENRANKAQLAHHFCSVSCRRVGNVLFLVATEQVHNILLVTLPDQLIDIYENRLRQKPAIAKHIDSSNWRYQLQVLGEEVFSVKMSL